MNSVLLVLVRDGVMAYVLICVFICALICALICAGGLNYVLLVLVREGVMTSLQQKAIDAQINTWLRGV